MSREACLKQYLDKIDVDGLLKLSDRFEKKGQSPEQAFVSAVEAKITTFTHERAKVTNAVRSEYGLPRKESTRVIEADQTQQSQPEETTSEAAAPELTTGDLDYWKEKLGTRYTAKEVISADKTDKSRVGGQETEIKRVTDAMQTVLDAKDQRYVDEGDDLLLAVAYLADTSKWGEDTFGSKKEPDLRRIPTVVREFLSDQETVARAARAKELEYGRDNGPASKMVKMLTKADERERLLQEYRKKQEDKKEVSAKTELATLKKAAAALSDGKELVAEDYDPSAPIDYGPVATKELEIRDKAIAAMETQVRVAEFAQSDKAADLSAGLIKIREQRNAFERAARIAAETRDKAEQKTQVRSNEDEAAPDMAAEREKTREAALERAARRLDMGSVGVDISTSNMKPHHITQLLEHYGIDVTDGVTPEAKKQFTTALKKDVSTYLKDGPEAVPFAIRSAIKAATEDKKGEVRYSTATGAPAAGLEKSAVERIVENYRKEWGSMPAVSVMTEADIPADKKDDYAGRLAAYTTIDGKPHILIMAHNMNGPASVVRALFHEGLGHHGLAKAYGEGLAKLMTAIYNTNATVKRMADDVIAMYPKDFTGEGRFAKAVEEVLAGASENGKPLQNAFQRVVAFVRSFLRRFGWNGKFSDNDVKAVLRQAHEAARAEGGVTSPSGDRFSTGGSAMRFSSASIPASFSEAAYKYGGASGFKAVSDTSYALRKLGDMLTPLPDIIRKYGVKGALPAIKEWFDAINLKEEERNRIKQKADKIADIIKPMTQVQKNLLSELGYDSTFRQEWGYDPGFKRLNKDGKPEAVKVTVDPVMKARFDKAEKEHPAVIKALKMMFAYGEEVRQDLRKTLKDSGMSDSFIVANQLDGPYLPLRRFGNFAVVLKSDKLIAAEKAAEKTSPSSAESKLVDKLKLNEDDFAFSRFETPGQAALFLREQLATGKYNKTLSHQFPYGAELNHITEMPEATLQRVLAHVKADAKMGDAEKKALEENIKDIHRQVTEGRLARQAQRQRKYRHGADTDMIRSFMAQSEADAGFMALMKHGGAINDAIYQVQREGDSGVREHKIISDLIAAHHVEIIKVKQTPWQDRGVAFTSAMQLASSPSYHLSNMSQVFMVTMPKLAAVFNDYSGAYNHIMKGYGLYRQITSGNILTGKTANIEGLPDGPLKEVLLHAVRRNLLDVGMDGDLTQFNKFQSGYALIDGTSAVASKALYKLRQVSRSVELMNRIATVSASYSMYMENHKGEPDAEAKAKAFALEMVETTQGDMSNIAAPLAIKLTPKIMNQYRKYQIMMVAFYADGFNKAFHGTSKEEQAIGRRMLAYKLFHTGMAAGVMGLPMINLVGPLLASLFGDDDEPKDFERSMRDIIGNELLSDLLLHGPLKLAGLDTSAKLGDEKVFSLMPFTDIDLSSKKGLALTAAGLFGGPAFGQASKMADGVGALQQGDYYKGIEKMLPKGLEDVFKGFRIANDGYTLKNGDVMTKPDDINAVAATLQMLGLPSTGVRRVQWLQSQQIEIKKFYSDREQELKRDYLKAQRNGDDTQAIKDDWREVQDGKAKVRKYFNNAPNEMQSHPMSALTDYVDYRNRRQERLQDTVPEEVN